MIDKIRISPPKSENSLISKDKYDLAKKSTRSTDSKKNKYELIKIENEIPKNKEKEKKEINKYKNNKEKRRSLISTERTMLRNSRKINNNFKKDNNKFFSLKNNPVTEFIYNFSSSKNSDYKEDSYVDIKDKCLICQNRLTDKEKEDNLLRCLHMVCDECYFDYLKEKINSNKVGEITCCQKDCKTKLYDEFIEKKLYKNIELLDRYLYLKQRRQIMLNPNTQLCPIPDCDSYAKKNGKNIFVQCIKNNHKFCFNCLKEWHEGKECNTDIDGSMDKYIRINNAKRCPKCKILIVKNEGCNHMICYNCKCEFCWLCLNECDYKHFEFGRCAGLLYNNSGFCNNKIINFLYQVFISFVKCILYGIGIGFINTFLSFFYYSEEYHRSNDIINLVCGICGVLTLLQYIVLYIPSYLLLSFITFFYWPLQDKLFVFKSSIILDSNITCFKKCIESCFNIN